MTFLPMTFSYKTFRIEFTKKAPFLYEDIVVPPQKNPIYVCVWEGRFLVSVYAKCLPQRLSFRHYQNFVRKFFRDVEYRSSYLQAGYTAWIEQDIPEHVLSSPLRKQIQELNEAESVSFNQMASLHWFIFDEYDDMSTKELATHIEGQHFDYVQEHCDSDCLPSVLCWIVRGLKPELAVYHATVEEEIRKNKRKSSPGISEK